MNNDVPSPKKIVAELDKHIVGQQDAKKIVAIALRNRWRRNQIKNGMQAEIIPKNILMIGPTGVGKTEIARRLSRMVNAPFIKVEATKFTEIGYVGRDVDSIIRDLLDIAINLKREERRKNVANRAEKIAKTRILKILSKDAPEKIEEYKQQLESDTLNDVEIEIELETNDNNYNTLDIPDIPNSTGIGIINITDMIGKTLGNKNKKKRYMKIKYAYEALKIEESDKLIDQDQIIKDAIDNTENSGIVFLDEVDKITPKSDTRSEVNREGVQRDLLPLIEGTIVNTKYGPVKTNYILFIASGAFHLSKPSDLLPELQGRLPVRVELNPLKCEDYIKILTDPKYSLLKQYEALIKTEKIELIFTPSGTKKIAEYAFELNNEVENIGARRLNTIMEKLLEDISFNADEAADTTLKITEDYVTEKLNKIITTLNLSKFIL